MVPVVAETAWLPLDRGGTEHQRRFLTLVTSGRLQPVELTAADWRHVLELVDTYADLRPDAIDGATIAHAEPLGLTTVATLDHRDFATVRPAHCDALTLLPGGGRLDE